MPVSSINADVRLLGMSTLDELTDKVHDHLWGRWMPSDSPRGRYILMKRLDAMWRKGPVRRRWGCGGVFGISQTEGSCWFNSICNALFFSDLGCKLMRALYVDWILRIRRDGRKIPSLKYFRLMTDLTQQGVEQFVYLDMFKIIHRLSTYSRHDFRRVGREQQGYSGSRSYLKNMIAMAGIPKRRICNVNVTSLPSEPGGWDSALELIREKIDKSRKAPMVVILYVKEGVEFLAPESFTASARSSDASRKYVLDAGTFSSDGGGHSIAGIRCSGHFRMVDSVGYTNDHDWSARGGGGTVTSHGFKFSTDRCRRTLVFYNPNMLNKLHNVARAIAGEWSQLEEPLFDDELPEHVRGRWRNQLTRID